MTHAELIDRVVAIMGNSDRTPRVRAEEIVDLVLIDAVRGADIPQTQRRLIEHWPALQGISEDMVRSIIDAVVRATGVPR